MGGQFISSSFSFLPLFHPSNFFLNPQDFEEAKVVGVREGAHEKLCSLLTDPITEVRSLFLSPPFFPLSLLTPTSLIELLLYFLLGL